MLGWYLHNQGIPRIRSNLSSKSTRIKASSHRKSSHSIAIRCTHQASSLSIHSPSERSSFFRARSSKPSLLITCVRTRSARPRGEYKSLYKF
ncbi:hypothetical protein Plhal304r1_c013g0049731 [Plasmopara halstedii]